MEMDFTHFLHNVFALERDKSEPWRANAGSEPGSWSKPSPALHQYHRSSPVGESLRVNERLCPRTVQEPLDYLLVSGFLGPNYKREN